jgi:hypothetical protein
MPVCKVATNSFIEYFGDVMYGPDCSYPKAKPLQRRKRIHHDFNIEWSSEFITTEEYKNYYKIAFVRNPWTRVVAAFRELMRRRPFGHTGLDEQRSLSYQKIYDLMEGYVSFENFINFIVNIEGNHTNRFNSPQPNAHWRPQVDVLHIKNKGLVPLKYDFIGKIENINEDFNFAQERLGLEKTKLCERHVTSKYNYKLYYQDPKIIDLVGEYYKEDIETFGYEFE